MRNIRVLVKNIERDNISTEEIKELFRTLEKCRNQDNNPDSQAYKRKIQVNIFNGVNTVKLQKRLAGVNIFNRVQMRVLLENH